VNTADVIRNLEPHTPLQIEVQCCRGHFIADMTLCVIDGQLAVRGERSGYDLRRRASQGKPDFNGYVHATPNLGTALQCAKCNDRPEYNMQRLALELAEAALRARLNGHAAVHRLTD
jgi:hypothetical protein